MHCLACGRPISFTRHRLARHAHTTLVGLDALRIAEVAIGDELDGEPFLRVVHEGQELMDAVHGWVHAFVGPSRKVRREVFSRIRHWESNMHVFVRAWASYDRPSYQEHYHSLSKLEAKLVREMVDRSAGEAARSAPRIVVYAIHGRDLRRSARRARSFGRPRPAADGARLGHADAR